MRKTTPLAFCCFFTVAALGVSIIRAQSSGPRRVNRAIELLQANQPVYYVGSHSGIAGTFEQGAKDADTYADYISYDMEHAPFDVKGLAEYMRGLASKAPLKSGHRTPAVIVNVPVNGLDEASVRANAWMFNQVLATGVHGIMLAHADDPGAVRAFVEAVRFPLHKAGLGKEGLREGRRGIHGVSSAAAIWGVSDDEYLRKADPWPLNPDGELLLGLKLEDKYALANADANLRIPGISFAEWGGSDMALSFGLLMSQGALQDPRIRNARAAILAACKRNHRFFLDFMPPADVIRMIDEGVMIGSASAESAEIGRRYTHRQAP